MKLSQLVGGAGKKRSPKVSADAGRGEGSAVLQKMSIAVFSRMGFMGRCRWWWHLISFLKISPMGFGGRCKSGATDWEEEGTKAAVRDSLAVGRQMYSGEKSGNTCPTVAIQEKY